MSRFDLKSFNRKRFFLPKRSLKNNTKPGRRSNLMAFTYACHIFTRFFKNFWPTALLNLNIIPELRNRPELSSTYSLLGLPGLVNTFTRLNTAALRDTLREWATFTEKVLYTTAAVRKLNVIFSSRRLQLSRNSLIVPLKVYLMFSKVSSGARTHNL